ncbi:MAG TPA: type II secretion system protein [Pirellulales bacterium]|jgi:prepilin-type N-terminal cleavage/methylation domain-containing protein|nr:type II secretion system protein [Pirellulales bacterium]
MQSHQSRTKGQFPRGFSLLELLAVVTILGILALIIVPRIGYMLPNVKTQSNNENKALINKTVERYYFDKEVWPANDLSDIAADPNYFPDGVPANPVDGTAYTLDPTTHRVN